MMLKKNSKKKKTITVIYVNKLYVLNLPTLYTSFSKKQYWVVNRSIQRSIHTLHIVKCSLFFTSITHARMMLIQLDDFHSGYIKYQVKSTYLKRALRRLRGRLEDVMEAADAREPEDSNLTVTWKGLFVTQFAVGTQSSGPSCYCILRQQNHLKSRKKPDQEKTPW